MALNSCAARSGRFSFKYSAALWLCIWICRCVSGCDWPRQTPSAVRRKINPCRNTWTVFMYELYVARASCERHSQKKRTAKISPSSALLANPDQKVSRPPSWIVRGPFARLVMLVALLGLLMSGWPLGPPVSGSEKLGWFMALTKSARSVSAARSL